MLLLEKLLALENETQLRKQEKPPPERESVQLQQEKVQEEKLQGDLEEELPEEEDARTSYSFFKYEFMKSNAILSLLHCILEMKVYGQISHRLYTS